MAHQQSSELLRVLGQLNDAVWAETLLPLLQSNRSVAAVALTCKQLRQLCHGNQTELKLTGANCKHLDPLELDAFNRRFPVVFIADVEDGAWLHSACVVPLLTRLPNLQYLQLSSHSWPGNSSSAGSPPAQMVPVLQLLRLQLPQLRSLRLVLDGSWDDECQQCWKMLGTATQLTKLVVVFNNNQQGVGDRGLSLQHLSALRPLGSGLQHLELTAERIDYHIPEDCSFLSSFSGLTSLRLPLNFRRSGLAAISSCTALQSLVFYKDEDQVLDAAECAALAQLTQLTRLEIPPTADEPGLLSALRCLSGLQTLRLGDMSSSHLPVLATLTKLTRLQSSWVDTPTDQATLAVCF